MLQNSLVRNKMLFIKNRNITDGIMTFHEITQHTHLKKKVRVALKLDFEKVYDKVNWDLLIQCHKVALLATRVSVWVCVVS